MIDVHHFVLPVDANTHQKSTFCGAKYRRHGWCGVFNYQATYSTHRIKDSVCCSERIPMIEWKIADILENSRNTLFAAIIRAPLLDS